MTQKRLVLYLVAGWLVSLSGWGEVLKNLPEIDAGESFFIRSELTPAILCGSPEKELQLFYSVPDQTDVGLPTYMAYMEKGGLQVVSLKDKKELAPDMTECWMLFWFQGSKGWNAVEFSEDVSSYLPQEQYRQKLSFDMPILVCFEHAPESINVSEDRLTFRFPNASGKVVLSALNGAQRLENNETVGWSKKIPEDTIKICRFQAGLFRLFPIAVKEQVRVDMAKDVIEFQDSFDYLEIIDDWKTPSLQMAPVPPIVALAKATGFPIEIDGNLTDTGIKTVYGPYQGIRNRDHYVWSVRGLLSHITTVDRYVPGDSPTVQAFLKKLRQRPPDPVLAQMTAHPAFFYGPYKLYETARVLDYLEAPAREKVAGDLKKAMSEIFLNPVHYVPSKTFMDETPLFSALGMDQAKLWKDTLHSCMGDSYKFNMNILVPLWAYGYYTGDQALLDQRWNTIIRPLFMNFRIFMSWARLAPADWAGDHFYGTGIAGTLSYARMAYALNKAEDFAWGASTFARMAIAAHAWEQGLVPFHQKNHCFNQPYDFNNFLHTYTYHNDLGVTFAPLTRAELAGGAHEHWAISDSLTYRFLRDFEKEPAVRFFENIKKYCPGEYMGHIYTVLPGAYLMGEKPETLAAVILQKGSQKQPFCWAGGIFDPLYDMAVIDSGSVRTPTPIASALANGPNIRFAGKTFGTPFFNYVFELSASPQQAQWPTLSVPGLKLHLGEISFQAGHPTVDRRWATRNPETLSAYCVRPADPQYKYLYRNVIQPVCSAADLEKRQLFVYSVGSRNISVIDMEDCRPTAFIPCKEPIASLAWGPSRKLLVALSAEKKCLLLMDPSSGEEKQRLDLAFVPYDLRVIDKERKLVVQGEGKVAIIHADTLEKVQETDVAAHPSAMALDQEHQRLYVACRKELSFEPYRDKTFRIQDPVYVIDTTNGKIIQQRTLPGPINALAVDSVSGRLFVACGSFNLDALYVLDAATLEPRACYPLNDFSAWTFAKNSLVIDGQTGIGFLSASGTRNVVLFNARADIPSEMTAMTQAFVNMPEEKARQEGRWSPQGQEAQAQRIVNMVKNTSPVRQVVDCGGYPGAVALDPIAARIFVVNESLHGVNVVGRDGNQELIY